MHSAFQGIVTWQNRQGQLNYQEPCLMQFGSETKLHGLTPVPLLFWKRHMYNSMLRREHARVLRMFVRYGQKSMGNLAVRLKNGVLSTSESALSPDGWQAIPALKGLFARLRALLFIPLNSTAAHGRSRPGPSSFRGNLDTCGMSVMRYSRV